MGILGSGAQRRGLTAKGRKELFKVGGYTLFQLWGWFHDCIHLSKLTELYT